MRDITNKKLNRRRNSGRDKTDGKPTTESPRRVPIGWLLFPLLFILVMLLVKQLPNDSITWDEFVKYLKSSQLEDIKIGETEITG